MEGKAESDADRGRKERRESQIEAERKGERVR